MSESTNLEHPTLSDLLTAHRASLERFLTREGSGLLRQESSEDLVQAVHLQALGASEHFEYQGEAPFRAWLFTVARQVIARRHEYWKALKRDAGQLLRIEAQAADDSRSFVGLDPTARAPGPVTFAARREQLQLVIDALGTLKQRDRDLIGRVIRGESVDDVAHAMDLSREAAQRALHRARDRFRTAYSVLEKR